MDNGIDIVLEDEELEVEVQEDFLKGDKGDPGYTPVRGIDYYTEQDKQELIDELTEDIQGVKNDFNTNVATKTNEFNANVVSKTTEFNNNATNKMAEFNANTITKINKYNENAKDLINRVIEAEAENERLRNDLSGLPTGQAEGETIDITDSAEMRFSNFKIRGNSRQETREGYNLLNSDTLIGKTVSEVASNDSNIAVHMTEYNLKADIEYAFVLEVADSEVRTHFILSFRDTSNTTVKNITSSNIGTTFSLTEDELNNSSYCYLYWNQSGDFGSKIITKLMIVESVNISKDHEQYGTSPSSVYPSEIESCGDNIQLFDGTNRNYYINANANEAGIADGNTGGYVDVSKVTNVTISSTSVQERFRLGLANELPSSDTKITLQNGVNLDSNSSKKATIDTSNYSYLIINASDLNIIKIEKGKVVTPYSPYGQGCINEVVCNENILNIDDFTKTSSGITVKVVNGVINVSGTSTANTSILIPIDLSLRGNTFTYGVKIEGTLNSNVASTRLMIENNTPQNYYSFGNNYITLKQNEIVKLTETITDIKKFTVLLIHVNSGNTVDFKAYPKVEVGSEATDYVQHQSQTFSIPTQQPMRSIGDIRDTFVKVDGKWFERHYINRAILDGTETISAIVNSNSGIIYGIRNIWNKDISTRGNILCSHLKNAPITWGAEDNCVFGGGSSEGDIIYFKISKELITDSTEFLAWLSDQYNAGTPVYVDYLLATPIDIECTPEQVAILDEIDNTVKTYKGVTHILSTDNVEPYVKVTYKKDIETLFNALAGSGV